MITSKQTTLNMSSVLTEFVLILFAICVFQASYPSSYDSGGGSSTGGETRLNGPSGLTPLKDSLRDDRLSDVSFAIFCSFNFTPNESIQVEIVHENIVTQPLLMRIPTITVNTNFLNKSSHLQTSLICGV
jgi:hypothetical protein